MPAGCDFICKNESCQNHKSGFVLTGAWPLGNIALVINSAAVKKNIPFRDGLIKLKADGKRHVCIQLPNIDDIPVEGYRFNMWCPSCYRMWQHDEFFDDTSKTLDDLMKKVNIIKQCLKCNSNLMAFEEVIAQGVTCLSCGQKLTQSRWFSNETIKD